MAQKPFGGAHTKLKLDKLSAYLDAYTTALKKQNFRLIYVDAFAGTGDVPRAAPSTPMFEVDDYAPFVEGSAVRALTIRTPFDEYIFIEKSPRKAAQLERLKTQQPAPADRIAIVVGDANAEVRKFCAQRDWNKCRAVVFLDPFGNQLVWETLVAIARTEAIDLWYLFPAGLGVHRQIARDGSIDESHGPSLDSLLGTAEWRKQFVETQPSLDLFGEGPDRTTKTATPESITRFMIARMRKEFRGGVLDEWLTLGSRVIHMYSLLFAWANPSAKAALSVRVKTPLADISWSRRTMNGIMAASAGPKNVVTVEMKMLSR